MLLQLQPLFLFIAKMPEWCWWFHQPSFRCIQFSVRWQRLVKRYMMQSVVELPTGALSSELLEEDTRVRANIYGTLEPVAAVTVSDSRVEGRRLCRMKTGVE